MHISSIRGSYFSFIVTCTRKYTRFVLQFCHRVFLNHCSKKEKRSLFFFFFLFVLNSRGIKNRFIRERKVLERCVSLSRLVVASNGKDEDPLSRAGVDGTMRARKIVMSDAAFFFRGCAST